MANAAVTTLVAFASDPGDTPVWTDISDRMINLTINRGRQRELDRFVAGRLSLTLNNEDRVFDPTVGPTAQWVDLPGTSGNYLSTPDSDAVSLRGTGQALRMPGVSAAYVATPDSVALSFTGDIDVRAMVTPDAWNLGRLQMVVTSDLGDPNRRFRFYITATGLLGIDWMPTGSVASIILKNSTVVTGLAAGTTKWIRVTLDVDNGAAGNDVKFYTSDDGSVWTQLGATVTTAGVTSLPNTTGQYEIGSRFNGFAADSFQGLIHKVEVRNGIAGTVVASPDFTLTPWVIGDTTAAARSDGTNTWTLNGNTEIVAAAERRSLRLASSATASTPDSAAVSVTGDLDIRVKVAMDDWTPAGFVSILNKRDDAATNPSYRLALNTSGTLDYTWWTGGVGTTKTSSAAAVIADGAVKWLRVIHDVNNGAAGNDVKFYTSDDGVTWTQLGTTQTTAGVTTIDDTTSRLSLGGISGQYMTGNIFYAEVRNGIDGTIVANPNFQARPWDVGDTSTTIGTDAIGNTWTLNGAGAVIQRGYTSDLDVRAKVSLDDWTPAVDQSIIGQLNTTGNQRAWRLYVTATTGRLSLTASSTGVVSNGGWASTVSPTVTDGAALWVRVTLDPTDTVNVGRAKFYTSPDGVTWTQLGADVTAAYPGYILDSTAALEIGSFNGGSAGNLAGNVYYAEVRNGIDGIVVARFDANAQRAITTTTPTAVTGGAAETWTLNGTGWTWGGVGSWAPYYPNVVPMRRIKIQATYGGTTYDVFTGYVDSWNQEYQPPQSATCRVEATDAFKVLANAELLSSAYAETVASDGPVVVYRLGEPAGSTVVTESVSGTYPLRLAGTPTFGSAGLVPDDPDGAVSFPSGSDGVFGIFPEGTWPLSTATSLEILWQYSSGISGSTRTIAIAAAIPPTDVINTELAIALQVDTSGNLVGVLINGAGGAASATSSGVNLLDGLPHHLAVTWSSGGGTLKVYVDGVDRTASTSGSFAGSLASTTRKWTVAINSLDYPPFGMVGTASTADEYALYTRVLSPTEIGEHASAWQTAWAGESSGDRINRILDTAPWPAADRDVDDGASIIQAATLGGSVLAYLQKIEESEQGSLFIDASGKVRFIGRDSLLQAPYLTSQATFGDVSPDLEYADLSYVYDDQLIYNEVQVSREGGTTQVVGDADSQARYLRRTKVFDGVLYTEDATARGLAEWFVAHYAEPLLRATDMRLQPSAGNEATHFPQVLDRDLMERVTVKRKPQNLGPAIDQQVLIEGITHEVTPMEWRTRWNLSPAETQHYWLAEVAGYGEAGVTTYAGF